MVYDKPSTTVEDGLFMELTLKEASEQTGLTKPGLIKAIKKGTLSGKKDHNGQWRIDASELFRVYPKIETVNTNYSKPVDGSFQIENMMLQREIELLRERLDEKDALLGTARSDHEKIVADLKEDRDKWRQQATALLTDQRQKQTPRGFWQGLFR